MTVCRRSGCESQNERTRISISCCAEGGERECHIHDLVYIIRKNWLGLCVFTADANEKNKGAVFLFKH